MNGNIVITGCAEIGFTGEQTLSEIIIQLLLNELGESSDE